MLRTLCRRTSQIRIPKPTVKSSGCHTLCWRKCDKIVFVRHLSTGGAQVPDVTSNDPGSVRVHAFLQAAQKHRIPAEIFHSCVEQTPSLLDSTLEHFEEAILFLKTNSINPADILPVLQAQPRLLQGGLEQAANVIHELRTQHFHEGSIQKLVMSYPEVLAMKPLVIRSKHAFILELFRKPSALKLFLRLPQLYEITEDDIKEKVHYIVYTMGQGQHKIPRTSVLARPLWQIQCRHEFLCRLGFYHKPDKHGKTSSPNPSLARIMDTTDQDFALHVAKSSLQEYQVFVSMVEAELAAEDSDSEDWERRQR